MCSTRSSNPRLVLTGVVCVAALMAPARTAGNDGMTVVGKVEPVPATSLVLEPASFFDLEGKTVTFTPNTTGGYSVRVGSTLAWVETDAATGRFFTVVEPAVEPPGPFDDRFRPNWIRRFGEGEVTGINLPFAFPFAGRTWTRVHANTNGNVSFAAPETTHWEQRDPWPDGSMRSVAAAVDSRSVVGLEAMIAVLWAIYGETAISVDTSSARVTITWNAARPTPADVYFEPVGPNVFQVRLYPSGKVEFAYRRVSERDGIVGLFQKTETRGRVLSAVDDGAGDAPNATVDIVSAEIVDNGSTVIASVTMVDDIPDQVPSGAIEYRFFLDFDGFESTCLVGLRVDASGRKPFTGQCDAAPGSIGYAVQGPTLEIPISKIQMPDDRTFSWWLDAVWWGREEWDQIDGYQPAVTLDDRDHDLSAMAQAETGNVVEVFHYPSIVRNEPEVMSYVYGRLPADDEFAVVFTDFRFDHVFNKASASGPINTPVHGIGDWQADPNSGSDYASEDLLAAVKPVFVGGPGFAESGVDPYFGGEFRRHSYAVSFIAHELVHRWAAHLRFCNSQSFENLTDDYGCECHWSEWLHAPIRHSVWRRYSNRQYPEASVMGGSVWQDNGNGTFKLHGSGWPLAVGLSDLDLYVMGMIPSDDVGPTFLLRDVVETGTQGLFRATRVPVRIEDVVAAMGPRVPGANESRKTFRLGVYLLHENGRTPHGYLLARTQSITEEVVDYFRIATGGP